MVLKLCSSEPGFPWRYLPPHPIPVLLTEAVVNTSRSSSQCLCTHKCSINVCYCYHFAGDT